MKMTRAQRVRFNRMVAYLAQYPDYRELLETAMESIKEDARREMIPEIQVDMLKQALLLKVAEVRDSNRPL